MPGFNTADVVAIWNHLTPVELVGWGLAFVLVQLAGASAVGKWLKRLRQRYEEWAESTGEYGMRRMR